MAEALRCLIDGAMDGAGNMARDEAVFRAVGGGQVRATLRFYRWDPPTVSLGYFQKYAEFEALAPPARELAVVRRLTGGGAILHAAELTYSVTVPTQHELVRKHPNDLYVLFHDALIAALASLGLEAGRCGQTVEQHSQQGPFFCFQRRHCYDVLVGGRKIAGSAQKRTAEAILQHGSIILDDPFRQQASFGGIRADDAVVGRLIAEIPRRLPVAVEAGSWTDEELTAAEALRAKYLDPAWTRRL